MPYKEVKIDEEGNNYLVDPVGVDFTKPVDPPELPILDSKVSLTKYPFIGDEDFILNMLIIEYYDQKHKESVELSLREVCNQIIHSYVWRMITNNGKDVYGVLMVSDRRKKDYIYMLSIDDWINVLNKCALESTV